MQRDPQGSAQDRFKDRLSELDEFGYITLPEGAVVKLRLGLAREQSVSYVETPILIELQEEILVAPGIVIEDDEYLGNYYLVSEELLEAHRKARQNVTRVFFRDRTPDHYILEMQRISKALAQRFLEENGIPLEYEGCEILDLAMDIQE